MANPNPLEGAQEIQTMLVSYAKQETVEPLKRLGFYIAFGVAGALFVFLGTFFIGLGILRLLQTETGSTFGGSNLMSTVPYLITCVVLLVVMGVVFLLFNRAKKKVLS